MKLYKGDKVMQSVDKDQLDICLEAGWSRTEPVEEEEINEEEDLLDDDLLDDDPDDVDDLPEDVDTPAVPVAPIAAKKNKIKPLKKRK